MVQSFPFLYPCTLRLLYRARVSGFVQFNVVGPANPFIGQKFTF
jgi:hypothetical protein